MSYVVYMLSCADHTLYTGITTDIDRRIQEHNASPLGAKYTHARRPVLLAYKEMCESRSEALKREAAIKKLSRLQKQELIASHGIVNI